VNIGGWSTANDGDGPKRRLAIDEIYAMVVSFRPGRPIAISGRPRAFADNAGGADRAPKKSPARRAQRHVFRVIEYGRRTQRQSPYEFHDYGGAVGRDRYGASPTRSYAARRRRARAARRSTIGQRSSAPWRDRFSDRCGGPSSMAGRTLEAMAREAESTPKVACTFSHLAGPRLRTTLELCQEGHH